MENRVFCFFNLKRSILKILKNIPYNDITKINRMLRNIFVLIIAKMSNPFEIFFANICVTLRTDITNIIKISIENIPVEDVIIKNQNDNPAVTASDLNRGELVCILNRIDKCH